MTVSSNHSKGAPMTIAIDVHLDADAAAQMARDVRRGLTATPKELSPKYFYDERGSQLFEAITELEEYYPTRREREILVDRSAEIVAAAGNPATLVELGSGSAAKTRHLLSAMRDAGSLRTYVPVDISEEITQATALTLVEEYPGLDVHGMVSDFERHLERTPTADDDGPRLIAFLGGTVGNLYPDQRVAFLERIAALLGPADHLLLGTDLIKDRARLELAYDDPGGVTAEFNKNVLAVLNRELGADFDLDAFAHVRRLERGEPADGDRPALARRPGRHRRASSTSPCTSTPARSCGPRSRPSSPVPASKRSTPKPASPSAPGSPTPAGDYALSLAAPAGRDSMT